MPTQKQIRAAKKVSENIRTKTPKTMGEILLEAGYAESTSQNPDQVTESKGFNELMEELLPDQDVLEAHQQLLQSTRIEHMVFPLYKDPEADIPEEGDLTKEQEEKLKHAASAGETLSDKDIETMLAEVNCKVRKIVHGETARHVYFWSPDATARKNAIELAYKIKGRITNKVQLDGNLRTSPFGELSAEELRNLANPKPAAKKPTNKPAKKGGGNGKK